MYLSNLVNKPLLLHSKPRGVCLGVGFSLKNFSVKYLLCTSQLSPSNTVDFCLPLQAVESIDEQIILSRLRPVLPQNCAKLFLGAPLFLEDGRYLGKLQDVVLDGFIVRKLFTDQGTSHPARALLACSDALILRKEIPFPLGQTPPTPLLSKLNGKQGGFVTKPLLRTAIQKGELIKLTLSLPPFSWQA